MHTSSVVWGGVECCPGGSTTPAVEPGKLSPHDIIIIIMFSSIIMTDTQVLDHV